MCVCVCVSEREKCILLNSESSFAALLQSMHREIMLPEVFLFVEGGGQKKLTVTGVCKRRI